MQYVEVWCTWPTGQKIGTHVGCMQLLLTNNWGPYQLVGPFCDGVIGPITQRSGRTTWQALDQPINTTPPGGWIQAATLGVHDWIAISV